MASSSVPPPDVSAYEREEKKENKEHKEQRHSTLPNLNINTSHTHHASPLRISSKPGSPVVQNGGSSRKGSFALAGTVPDTSSAPGSREHSPRPSLPMQGPFRQSQPPVRPGSSRSQSGSIRIKDLISPTFSHRRTSSEGFFPPHRGRAKEGEGLNVQFADNHGYYGNDSSDEEFGGTQSAPGTPRRRSGVFRRAMKFSRDGKDGKDGKDGRDGGPGTEHHSEPEDTESGGGGGSGDLTAKGARPSLFKKLRALSSSHTKTQSNFHHDGETDDESTPTGTATPTGDAEQRSSSPGGNLWGGGSRTMPNTPALIATSPSVNSPVNESSSPRSPRPRRRATMTDAEEDSRRGRRHRSHPRPTSFRRITQLAHSRRSSQDLSGPATGSPTPVGGGGASASAAKWKALKAGLRMIGQRKKEEAKIDREKSAELVAELTAGVPAALIFASMFQRDEHGNKRIPILLEQVKIRITDSKSNSKARAHTVFRIELEYGSGLTRMKWVIHREFRDFFNLHSKYRAENFRNTTFGSKEAFQLPRFPRATIPYLRGVRGLTGGSDPEDDDDDTSGNEAGPSGTREGGASLSEPSTPLPTETRKQTSLGGALARKFTSKPPAARRKSSASQFGEGMHASEVGANIAVSIGALAGATIGAMPLVRRDGFAVKQRQKLEKYLQGLIRIMIFRPDSNRLCKFLELSALGIRLAAENSYHGKEGYLVIRSSKGSDFRRVWNPATIARRHSPKWFLVRHSYIVCVDSPENMNIYDVFLVDSQFSVDAKKSFSKKPKDIAAAPPNPAHPQHHSLKINNSERRMKLLAKNERQLNQFYDSIKFMQENTIWAQEHRFSSFAPPRQGVFAQWLVDGRDYMWNVSRAISMAKDVIYIHDWWLSPELYLRRPAGVSQKWRLDRLLQRKASEGVKIFVIVYRNIGAAIPIDSSYTKYSLLDLHPNIFVQRSPNQIRQNTFFWAHHEKILIVDHCIAFMGGIDLCFGRWDTPQHAMTDDKYTGFDENDPKDPDQYQLWPGKDYSNPRVQDFYELNKPYEEMYDRQKVARMPWHDISMQIIGQPARDLTRHFVQRWNYLLRQRKPSRPTPVLLPPADFTQAEIDSLGIGGSCEVQILRSACSWSMGLNADTTECSILNAYLKLIETSKHFVYIENQFFITSTELGDGRKVENSIGDALVERIIRAYNNDEDWRAIILIPLMPGFQNTVDQQEGTSVRLIMQCQYLSICRGEHSIFGKLRAHGIEPEDYIQFYGLRTWGKIGPQNALVTEQLYIHAKCMIVDDTACIIGSANINERSMLGYRDSEVAALVRDTDFIWSEMGGQQRRVGRFPHTLRMRLMREHLGIDVDEVMAAERLAEMKSHDPDWKKNIHQWQAGGIHHDALGSPTTTDVAGGSSIRDYASTASASASRPQSSSVTKDTPSTRDSTADGETHDDLESVAYNVLRAEQLASFNHDVDWEQAENPNLKSKKKKPSADSRVTHDEHMKDVMGYGVDHMAAIHETQSKGKAAAKHHPSPLDRKTGTHDKLYTSDPSQTDGGMVRSSRTGTPVGAHAQSDRASSHESEHGAEDTGNVGLPPPPMLRNDTSDLPLPSQLPPLPSTNDMDIGGPGPRRQMTQDSVSAGFHPLMREIKRPVFDENVCTDPLNDSFFLDVWHEIASNNTKIYRQVFRCMPDNEVKNWREYKEYQAYSDKFAAAQDGEPPNTAPGTQRSGTVKSAAPGAIGAPIPPSKIIEKVGAVGDAVEKQKDKVVEAITSPTGGHHSKSADPEKEALASAASHQENEKEKTSTPPKTAGDSLKPLNKSAKDPNEPHGLNEKDADESHRKVSFSSHASDERHHEHRAAFTARSSQEDHHQQHHRDESPSTTKSSLAPAHMTDSQGGLTTSASSAQLQPQPSVRRRRRAGTRSSRREFQASDDLMDKATAEELLSMVQGHLVVWPYDWLVKEDEGGNWLYSIDQLAPIEIYN